MMRSFWIMGLLLALCASVQAAPQVRVVSTDFVLSGKFTRLASWASEAGIELQAVQIEHSQTAAAELVAGVNLLILDTPRPTDLAAVQQHLGEHLQTTGTPWIRVGGGPPAFGNLPPLVARTLMLYYGNGGEFNQRQLFAYLNRWQRGQDTSALPAPQALPTTGFYHPDAPQVFDQLEAYLVWGASRWQPGAPRVAYAIAQDSIADAQTELIDALVRRSEARGQMPLMFWFDDADPLALTAILRPAAVDVLVNLQHMRNGPARQAEFVELDIPVLQAFTSREADREGWRRATSGIPPRTLAALLGVPETWGVSDPLVIAALEQGSPVALDEQLDALLDKAARLARLRHAPPADKRVAVLFWNHPGGERNFSASHLNVPRSLAVLTETLSRTGYAVTTLDEAALIEAGQRLLAGYYRPETLDVLRDAGLAAAFPLAQYQRWLAGLPQAVREAVEKRWGDPAQHWALREIDGQLQFVIPRLQAGSLMILPQPPRTGRPGESYHDTSVPPDHLYLAAYQFLREGFAADALIHFGTHGTQEWLPGKDRGLSVHDYPFLAVGNIPVFYPYIQDNIGEAIQAKRRGRAVTISHQTPPFAPAGLYDELRDLHELIHEYQQLEEGAVREQTMACIVEFTLASDLQRDLDWNEADMRADFPAFFSALHDHLHALAEDNMPLGLHTLGLPASPEHRLATVLQQLGEPYRLALGGDLDEPLSSDFAALQETPAYRTLARYLRDGEAIDGIASPALREQIERARGYDANLAQSGELEALVGGLAGGFVAPGPGGDPVRNPTVPSGRNLYAFEANKLPTRAAYQAGHDALLQLIDTYRADNGALPEKLAFSLWSSEAIRHLGILESQVLHALGLRPVWDEGGRVTALEIIPAAELGRPRIDVVLQVTSVYRDQFDGFMRLLAGAIERLAELDEAGNPVAANSRALATRLRQQGMAAGEAERLSQLRLFGNAPGDYGSGVSQLTLDSTTWEDESALAEQFLSRLQYAYGSDTWGEALSGGNLFAEQLKGVQAAILSRSSELNGVLSTDHPFEYLGGLSLAVRHLDGASPALYIADLRQSTPRTTATATFLATELRSRYLNPQWIGAMQAEGYAGTLEVLNIANNLWGWQAADRNMVRADQWQALHDTFINDQRELGIDQWFEQHNPTAQAQLVERLVEAIRKGYWHAGEQPRRELVERWQALTTEHGADAGDPVTRAFLNEMASGFGLQGAPGEGAASNAALQTITGQILQEVSAAGEPQQPWLLWLGAASLLLCLLFGAVRQLRTVPVHPSNDFAYAKA